MNAETPQENLMRWTKEQLSDDDQYIKILQEAIDNARAFYHQEKGELISQILAKMERGAAEHKTTIYPPERLTKEIEQEYLDLIGWLLVKKWNEQYKP